MNQEHIRNFSIIAHIDHGKSTLADRLLELTHTIESKKMKPQFLDSMELEREKGITIKLKSIRMNYNYLGSNYVLNLVDTPGHVDFTYEVSRSLAAVEGTVLLVDAGQGIQAQTLANLELAKKQNLVIIPVINKIDLPQAKVQEVVEELVNLLKIDESEILKVSAKTGENIEQVLKAVIEKIPAPKEENLEKPFRALIFDSDYDAFKGVIAFIRIVDGEILANQKIKLFAANAPAEIKELGYFNPGRSPQNKLYAGEIGYIATGIKEPGKVMAGDTIVKLQFPNVNIEPLPGYQEPKPMVFASFYPENPDDFDLLKDALSKLKLNDPALTFEPEKKEALGRGFMVGFLGTLHVEIVAERLRREFNLNLVISTPSVVFKIIDIAGQEKFIYSASDWPDVSKIKETKEPWVLLEIITPLMYLGKLMEILKNLNGVYVDTQHLSAQRAIIIYEVPLRGVITGLYDKIKSVSQGYASMNYKMSGLKPGKLVKMEIWIAGKKEEALSKIVSENESYREGKFVVDKLKEVLAPEQFSVALQAVISGKVIARETIKARRKDVTGYLYGGDITRKRKLLEKQKKGKKLMKGKGTVQVPTKAFLEIFKNQ
ncbi:MAG: elongation factor 4 [Candidatus Staskawiczbacteria bacterium RIFCSPLOWO2_01_FULL_33_9]|uniref:Elongation factor 4 n=1 Tax=Candidatus Staskawiczbacteria bacterium RIFCSPLOWO2_01_FULL_33_9 TaxID=1802211 RepID=A0A1G2I8C5_9BACT|nr:MAG: elongation factor 4 [Candidatus Staskawiczbacteria bacterium RIFCSPLOWO2_01_FULL_33_9]